jgi:hypothetical protein
VSTDSNLRDITEKKEVWDMVGEKVENNIVKILIADTEVHCNG